MGYVFLSFAIAVEVIGTLSLRASEGFSKPLFTVLVAVGYLLAFVFLSLALSHGLPLSVAYALWAAAGVAAVAILSVPIFGEGLSMLQVGGIALVVTGVVAIELGRSSH